MGAKSRELFLLLAVCAVSHSLVANKTLKDGETRPATLIDQYEDYTDDQEVLFNEDRPCPRDCICTLYQGYKIAKCNRLEVNTQKFGDDITDLVVENADPAMRIQLTDTIFKKLGLHKIATVKIVNSTIDFVSPSAFHGLSELYAVNLSNNKLKSLHPETFANNKKLLLLTLANNPLKFPEWGSNRYFLNATAVQELDISYCNMKYIAASTFENMPGLMYLNVAGNNLSDMDPDTFKKLLDLEELDLSDNNIKSLPDDIFSENNELATLHIQRNPIESVYGLNISDLLTLNAGQTNIKFVGPSMFNGMKFIANLNLSGNNMEKIHNQAFHKLIELNYLDLSYNNLTFISSILIKENIELDIFKISNNPLLRHLPVEGFNCSAEQFNIYLFDASNCGLEEVYDDSLKTFTALSVINLSGNNIKSLNNKVFSVCPKLVEVNLADNMLTTLDIKVFEKNNELGKLYLRGNPLKVLSAEVFIHTPLLTWLDISNTELTSLWKTNKNHPETLLSNLTFLNASQNHITEIKQNQLDTLNRLRSLDISNNPLVCNREFENLMTWLSKRLVSPDSNTARIANLATDAKEDDEPYSWEFLTLKTCGKATVHPVEPLPAVSDEEIWERIDEDREGNFDLKNTLDDGKVADTKVYGDDGKVASKIDDPVANDVDDADDEGDDEDEDDEEEDDDDASEDYDDGDDDVDLKVKLLETTTRKQPPPTESSDKEIGVKMAINLLENDSNYDDLEREVYVGASVEEEHGHYDYLWPILIAVLGALLLLIVIAKVVMVVCSRKSKQVRYNSAIIAAMSHPGRTKKDCGLVYQQLSEDLTGPATPKLSRYQPLPAVTVASNMSYESSPFHHNNIVPEAV
ncbi:insulin-like growth factor-binding protein complex acid labile subunit [Ostrinia nubilalis]|uniref:insulin-like growth factor-binding protein complex acid labile subunit n=1 Tax=Ostrinia nubilalis TaxID=29057 RepID=UPI00308268BA